MQSATPTLGEMHLSQSELDGVVAAAIAQWAHAGASAAQLGALHATTFSIADLAPGIVGEEQAPAHITIDVNGDGHGWFVDPTPANNSEFTHAAFSTDLFTDPTNAAAGHLDLLTTVTHELGHVLGLPDLTNPSAAHDLMYISLVDGERRLPDAANVAQASGSTFSFAAVGTPTPPAPVVTSNTQPVTTDQHSSGGDNFVFAQASPAGPTLLPGALLNFFKDGGFDFSAIVSQFHAHGNDAMITHGDAGSALSPYFGAGNGSAGDDHGMPGGGVLTNSHVTLPDFFQAFHFGQNHVDLVV